MPDSSARIAPLSSLVCPIDGTPLHAGAGEAMRCATGHTFDRARAGYTNLLVVQHKASRDPGDSKEMVASRRRVLDAGHYAPIADRVADIVRHIAAQQPAHRALSVVDAGCGEGYYLNAIAAAAEKAGTTRLRLAGIDISKWAIQAAAKRRLPCCWAVASNRHLPFVAGSVDLILSMFGFPLWESFAAVQPSGGRVLLVDPGPDHLLELRSIIYPSVTPKPAPSLDAAEKAGYRLDEEHRLRFQFTLTGAGEIAALLSMTPHDHRATTAGREALARLDKLVLTGDVALRLLGRGGDATSSL